MSYLMEINSGRNKKMKFYRILFDEAYKFLTIKNDSDVRFLRKKLSTATPVSADEKVIELIESEDSKSLTETLADFPGFYSGGLLATEKAKTIIEAKLSSCGQWIPMLFSGQHVYYFNTTSREDILDLDKSEVSMFDGYITDIKSFSFKPVDNHLPTLFKLDKFLTYPPIATQEFVDLIIESGLTGLRFEKL